MPRTVGCSCHVQIRSVTCVTSPSHDNRPVRPAPGARRTPGALPAHSRRTPGRTEGEHMSGEYEALAGQLDVPAKVRLLTGASMFTLQGAEEIGLGADGLLRRPHRRPRADLLRWPAGEPAAQRDAAGVVLGRGCCLRFGGLLAEEARAPGDPRRPRTDDQPAPQPTRRPPVRGLLRGPAADRPAGRRLRARAQAPGHRRLPEHLVANESETERQRWTAGWTRRPCASCTSCRSRSPSRTPTRGRSWPPTTTSTACRRPSRTTS